MSVLVRRNHDVDVERADDAPTPARSGWQPFAELEALSRQLTTLLDSWRNLPDLQLGRFTPLADVEETDDAYLVDVEVPGVKQDDVQVEVAGRRLVVHGERKEKERVGILRRRERTVGRMHCEVTLPGDVDDAGATANLDDGVLTVRLPKPERDRPRRITVR